MNTASIIFLKKPIELEGVCKVHPPTVRDVIESTNFPLFNSILTITQEDIEDLENLSVGKKEGMTPFSFLMMNFNRNLTMQKVILEGFHFYTHEVIRFLPDQKMIWFLDDLDEITSVEDLRVLKEEDYFHFQNAIRIAIGEKIVELPDPDEDPRIARIKAAARRRDRVKEKQEAKKGQSMSLETFLSALCCMGIGITPLNIGEISYASARLLSRTYQEQEKYRGDLQMLAAGADPKKVKPEYLIRNL